MLFLLAMNCVFAQAVTSTYTSRADFLAEIPYDTAEVDFEFISAGSTFPSNVSIGTVFFSHNAGGLDFQVSDAYDQTTPDGANALGLSTEDELFWSGDEVVMTTGYPVAAFGISIIASPGDVQPGDLTLFVEPDVFIANSATPDAFLPDGGEVYFFGLIIHGATELDRFSTAILSTDDPEGLGYFVFSIDDVIHEADPAILINNCGLVAGQSIRLVSDNPSGAIGLPAGTCGYVACTNVSAEPGVLVSFENWQHGIDAMVDCTGPIAFPPRSLWWVSCSDVVADVSCPGPPPVRSYDDFDDFFADHGAGSSSIDFESAVAGSTYPPPVTLGGVTLSHSAAGADFLVTDDFSQTTAGGSNSAGLDTADRAFLSGDSVTIDFCIPVRSFGLFVIGSPGDVQAGDFTLTVGPGTSVSNGATPSAILPDGGEAYFLGLGVESSIPSVLSATLISNDTAGQGFYVFNIDDLIFPTIENNPPTNIFLSNNTIEENKRNLWNVGWFSVLDDDPVDSHVLELIDVDPSPSSFSFLLTGNLLRTTRTLDYEDIPSYKLLIRCTDNCGAAIQKVFTIEVIDLPPCTVPGARVETIAPDPSGASALPIGSAGTVICTHPTDETVLLISFDGWDLGTNDTGDCDGTPLGFAADSLWWVECSEVQVTDQDHWLTF